MESIGSGMSSARRTALQWIAGPLAAPERRLDVRVPFQLCRFPKDASANTARFIGQEAGRKRGSQCRRNSSMNCNHRGSPNGNHVRSCTNHRHAPRGSNPSLAHLDSSPPPPLNLVCPPTSPDTIHTHFRACRKAPRRSEDNCRPSPCTPNTRPCHHFDYTSTVPLRPWRHRIV